MSEVSLRHSALRVGVRLEVITVAWMALEAVLAIGAGIAARSVLLTAFGADSLIELLSGATLLWRLARESSGGDLESVERVENRAEWVSAVLLALLCLYVLVSSVAGLVFQVRPESSPLGIAVTAAAVLVMPLLAWRKGLVNRTVESAALRADIAESIMCAYLAGTTLAGIALSGLTGWWWVQYVAATALLIWLGREALETLESARSGD